MTVPEPPRLYGRRKGRPLRVRKSRLIQDVLPHVQILLPEEGSFDPSRLFSTKPKMIWLEIGFGGGEHLVTQAEAHPDIGFIGCEPFLNGIASLLDHMDQKRVKHIRLFPDDARILLDALPDASINRCFVLFPDPWPKARHAERRFIGDPNIARLARVLAKDAELRLATDDPQLKDWIRIHMRAAKEFRPVFDTLTPPLDWVGTRYESKAQKAGRIPAYMGYVRI